MTSVGEDAHMASGHQAHDSHDSHDAHGHDDGHDDHGHDAHGHDDHGSGGDAWVLLPLVVGLVIGLAIVAVLGIDSDVAAYVLH